MPRAASRRSCFTESPEGNGWKSQSGGFCERKLLAALDNNPGEKKKIVDGENLNMKGEFPPCKKCHNAMKNWMKDNKVKGDIHYHYLQNQKIVYSNEGTGTGKSKVLATDKKGNAKTSAVGSTGEAPADPKQAAAQKQQDPNKLIKSYDDDHQVPNPAHDKT